MRQANIVIMGKTGTGKSTIVNAVMESDIAPTGPGRPVTVNHDIYSRAITLQENIRKTTTINLNLYDTVGLELNSEITNGTLDEITSYIVRVKGNSTAGDVNLVWFCVNSRLARFEPYEVNLIGKLTFDYEIPFIIVMTQCLSSESELERQIARVLPEVSIIRILAQDYKTRTGTLSSFGVPELLNTSIFDYNQLKKRLLKCKLCQLDELLYVQKNEVEAMERKGQETVKKYYSMAMKIGFLPFGCIPFVYGLCIKMLVEVDKVFHIKTAAGFEANIFANMIIGILVTPFLAVPVLSALTAGAYVQAVGESYLETIKTVVMHSTYAEISDKKRMEERIKKELLNRSKY